MEQRDLHVGDLTFDALVGGPNDGTPVLLLHGFPTSNLMWTGLMDRLSAEGFAGVAPNQRGYAPGARPADTAAYATANLAADVVGMLDDLGWERAHLVGHDWGAAVAWWVAARHPDRLMSLSALSVGHPDALARTILEDLGDQRSRSEYMRMLQRPDSPEVLLADNAAMLRRFTGWGSDGRMDLDVHLPLLRQPGAMKAATDWYRAMGGEVGPIDASVPVLFIWSDGDSALGPEIARLTPDYVRGSYQEECLAGVSHWLVEEARAQVGDLLVGHLRAVGPPATRPLS